MEEDDTLIRGVGPTLSQFGVSGVLAKPQIRLFEGTQVRAQNAGWSQSADAAEIAAATAQVHAFPLAAGSNDAALVVTLEPGVYTVVSNCNHGRVLTKAKGQ